MSLALYNAVPAGAIEVIFDNQTAFFKRADLGRYLGLSDIKATYRNVVTRTRDSLEPRGASAAPLPKNPNDMFLSIDGAIEVAVRSKKPKAVELIKWLARKGVEKIQEEHQLAIDEHQTALELVNNDLQAIQYELERIRPRCVERRGDYDNILVPFVKNKTDEIYPYYMIRCQYRNLDKQTNMLRVKYANMRVKGEYDDPNAAHHWVTFKKDILGKDNYHFNNFRLDGEHRELF